MNHSVYYRHSGRFGVVGLASAVVVGAIAAVLGGALYGVVVAWNPFVYFNVIGTVLAPAVVGGAVAAAARAGHVRNGAITAAVGLAAGLVCAYVQWCATLWSWDVPAQFQAPGSVWAAIQMFAVFEPWSMFDVTPSAGVFLGLWGVEGFIIVGGSALVAGFGNADPYCERCKAWTADEPEVLGPFVYVTQTETIRARLDRGDVAVLEGLERLDDQREQSSTIQVKSCTKCPDFHVATLLNNTLTTQSDGSVKTEEVAIAQNVLLDPGRVDALRKL